MIEVYKSEVFEKWLRKLRNSEAESAIKARIDRLKMGNFGDVKSVGGGIGEIRIHCGPGYRIYFAQQGQILVVLLCGGDKKTQDKDIRLAREIAANMEF